MEKKIRIAGIGGWHIHSKDFTDKVHNYPNAEVAAVWDNEKERGMRWAEEYGCPYYSDYAELLADKTIDAVMITCETTRHYEMIIEAAKAGMHIYVEKPPFVTKEEAKKARDIIEKYKVKFMLGSPVVKPMHLKTIEMLKEGLLGDLVSIRYRTVHELGLLGTHDPSFYERDKNGGGAMLDMGNHAIHLLSWFAGAPVSAKAIYTSHTELADHNGVDDNDIAVLQFENDVMGIIETGWVTPWYQYGFDLYGTKGSVSCRAYEMYVCLEDGVWRKVPDQELPEAEQYPLYYWIDCISENNRIERDDIEVSVLMTEISEKVEEASIHPCQPYVSPSIAWDEIADSNLEYALNLAKSGEMGDILNVRVHYCGKEDPEVLMDKAKSVIEEFFGKALGEKKVVSSLRTSWVTLLEYGDKKLGIAEANCGVPEYENAVDVCGTQGWLRIRGNTMAYTNTIAGDRNAIWHEVN
ncbi:MAG: Gfo/Idh/MocA family oxidoreductase [Lachnospiraceae bacterium]|nr:Gfo/Idh/MocA family oxidoreductase [Lachnospiraceae bacterium]